MLCVLQLLLREWCTEYSSWKFLFGHISSDFREGDCVCIIHLHNLVCFEKWRTYLSMLCVCTFIFCRYLKSSIIPEKWILSFKGFLGHFLPDSQIEAWLLAWAGIIMLSRKEVRVWWPVQSLSLEEAGQNTQFSKFLRFWRVTGLLVTTKQVSFFSKEIQIAHSAPIFPPNILYYLPPSGLHLF